MQGEWRNEEFLNELQPTIKRNPRNRYKMYRDTLKDYFNSEIGAVEWQENQVLMQFQA